MIRILNNVVAVLIFIVLGLNISASNLPEAKIIHYNNEDLIVDLGVGLWAFPIPYDYDRDGLTDLLVNCPDKPMKGLFYFRNIGTLEKPLFDKSVKLATVATQHLCCSEYNGQMHVMNGDKVCVDFFTKPFEVQEKVEYDGNEGINVHLRRDPVEDNVHEVRHREEYGKKQKEEQNGVKHFDHVDEELYDRCCGVHKATRML